MEVSKPGGQPAEESEVAFAVRMLVGVSDGKQLEIFVETVERQMTVEKPDEGSRRARPIGRMGNHESRRDMTVFRDRFDGSFEGRFRDIVQAEGGGDLGDQDKT